MKNYENTFLVMDTATGNPDFIIFTNETNSDKIQQLLWSTTKKWHDDNCPDCLMDYIVDELDKHIEYEILYLPQDMDDNKLYY